METGEGVECEWRLHLEQQCTESAEEDAENAEPGKRVIVGGCVWLPVGQSEQHQKGHKDAECDL